MIANAKRTNASDEYVAVTRIPIADQITRELLPTTGRRQLVGDPFGTEQGRRGKDPAVPRVVRRRAGAREKSTGERSSRAEVADFGFTAGGGKRRPRSGRC